ncbi:hypothetical protein G6F46_002091 [Rhizopus delemar]|uniref:NADH-cytochrome b5 reductase n=1 Tax=Rhizopus delemar TaxID=936053 RepID=A0A9P6Z844_9FUNG|nr:hypothetical protein G6F55_001134 [Rhizopus delemar]KAG1492767.1 hypothetical protein G6F54_009063 [Rhizopus delemar]KAG1517023.1 hypothetical protein G6F53_001695 [Rhizopus delemar]KAG1557736.1 hypothetical protein G6F49_005134 [Rhizopus delemar]KAG1572423.1 hypothetical protein G6F50_003757 [Rhizopus delemar]
MAEIRHRDFFQESSINQTHFFIGALHVLSMPCLEALFDRYRFQLPHPDDVLGLPIGQHISIMAEINGKQISRSYTPTSSDQGKGYFDLVIKSYPTGNISKLMDELKVGDSIGIRGPKGNFAYKRNMVKAIGMIAGGTGITPMLQIIRTICNDPLDKTKINLIFANVTKDDILLKDELDEMSAKSAEQFRVHYVLEKPPKDWTGDAGLVTQEMIKTHCPAPADDIKLLLCGPQPMIKMLISAITELGYVRPRAVSRMDDQVYKF